MSGGRTLVLLTLNEIDGVRAIVPKLPRDKVDEIIAVDGGSTDGTCEFLRENGIRVVEQKSRRGRGEAMRIAAESTSRPYLVFFSPDGNENPGDIPRLFEILESGAPLAIASRFLPGARNEEDDAALPLRKWVNQAFTGIVNLLWNRGTQVTDTINGFRGVSREWFQSLGTQSPGYSIEFEMTIQAMKRRAKIVEIPTVEFDRIAGETKAPSFRTGLVFVRLLLREIFKPRAS